VFVLTLIVIGWGLVVAPFDWDLGGLPRDPTPVDAIPDIGENQQIVFTTWTGRSPQDVEDQITYPLTVALLGIPDVKSIRSYSMFGFSTIYIIFKDGVDFYWSRSRTLEKLNSLPNNALPVDARPTLGPDATALGQVYWYTLEGVDDKGVPTGGWDPHELRSIQDWYVRYALMSVEGVSEVASIGGYEQEYQVDVDPDLMRAYGVKLEEVVNAVKRSNVDVGARVIEVNKVEYVVRGLGFIKNIDNLKDALVKVRKGNVPVFINNVAHVSLGPASRRGALDKGGVEVVGGVVVTRFGSNPMAVIEHVKKKIEEISVGLPKKTLPNGVVSQLKIVPFYDRTGLIHETLGTLHSALKNEILIAIIVVLVMTLHLRSSLIVSGLLPLSVLICFIAMKSFGVDANIVALSGIAIAIGTMVDMGIIICENILRRLKEADPGENRQIIVFKATREVGGAVLTAVSTTIISFLPVFTLVAAEGKLFRPLAFTKTFALLGSIITALTIIPPLAHMFLAGRRDGKGRGWIIDEAMIFLGGVLAFVLNWRIGLIVALIGAYNLAIRRAPESFRRRAVPWVSIVTALGVAFALTYYWRPLGPMISLLRNFVFVVVAVGGVLGFFYLFLTRYASILEWCLNHKALFLTLPVLMLVLGGAVWLGADSLLTWLPGGLKKSGPIAYLDEKFPGLGKEFMPPLDEGSFLFMPTTMPHASISEVLDIVSRQDRAIEAVPEVDTAVGKIGRAETALDPAPLSMIETVVNYKPEYLTDENGNPRRFKFDARKTDLCRDEQGRPVLAPDGKPYKVRGRFIRDDEHKLIPDEGGMAFRLWRPPMEPALNEGRPYWPGVRGPDDIWTAIVDAAYLPGTTSAPKLQPISARIVMLQSGIRASMGVKISGPDLDSIQTASLRIEKALRTVDSVEASTVIADRIIGKPYLEIIFDREAAAQHGIDLQQTQDVIETAIGGKLVSTTVEGRERYPIRVRYMRELRDDIEALGKVLVPAPNGTQIPLTQLAKIEYVRGPQVIKSEDTFLVSYVLFDKKPGYAEVTVVDECRARLRELIESGALVLPDGVSFSFTGSYENQERSEKKLMIILPLALSIIFVILYLQFSSARISLLVFSGIAVAWSGGFIMIWLYAQPWFLDFSVFGANMRELFQVHNINLSVAIWVGFLALFGIASDDGVVMATYLRDAFAVRNGGSVDDIRRRVIDASLQRVRPCLMTTATTVLALLPVLMSRGRGADIMVPMAIPSFGGMALEVITMLVVPVIYCAMMERKRESASQSALERNSL